MHKLFIFALVLVLVMAACAPEAQVLPTTIPVSPTDEATPEPTVTPLNLQRATLPPTWTPSPAANGEVQSQVTTDPAAQGTPAQQITQAPTFLPATPLEVCAALGEDRTRNKRTFKLGESPQVFWIPVQGAASYSISLIDETGTIVHTDYTAEPTFTFDATLFEQGKLYGWEVFPIDGIGQQMCLGRGAELFPEDPLAVTQAS